MRLKTDVSFIEEKIAFSVPFKDDDKSKKVTYKLKFIDSHRFMQSKFSDLVDNLSEIYKEECDRCMERKEIKSECDYIEFKNNRLNYRCKECKKYAISQ